MVCNNWIKKGTNVLGSRTAMELRGVTCIGLETHEEKRKNCCVSRSFGKKVTDLEKLEEAICTYSLNAAEKIRGDNQVCKRMTVFIRTSPFNKNRKYYSNAKTIDLPIATSNSIELVKNAKEALKSIYRDGFFYQKAGIILSRLKDADKNEINLLTPILEKKSKLLMKEIDYTNMRYGRHAISIANARVSKGWKMRKQHSSKIDTASFKYLPKVSAT